MTTTDRIAAWKTPPFDAQTIEQVVALEKNSEKLEDAFYKDADFGTGGMRGVMGVGTNRINKYTLGKASQGVANFLHKTYSTPLKVVIAFDCRNNSEAFAKEVAHVFSANEIEVYLFSSLRPTPVLSFTVRHLKAHAGIVLTASHNPPEYNGFKVYNRHGGQIVPPEDLSIISHINAIDYSAIRWDSKPELIFSIDQEIDQAYTKTIVEKSLLSPSERKNTSVIFTPLHGTAIVTLPSVLELAGYEQVHLVEEQAQPNGNFPTVKSPNPEEHEAFRYALEKAQQTPADLFFGMDPDADRLGIGVKDTSGEWVLLNGNQLMVVLTRFVLEKTPRLNNAFIASTVVSTPLMEKLATAFGVECKIGLTGFKWIGKMIQDYPEQVFLCGGEESYGYLFGTDVRDKDAISAALLACDLQAHLKARGSSIYTYLLDTYQRYGCYQEQLLSITKKGKKGAEEIAQMMHRFRTKTPTTIAGFKVIQLDDFLESSSTINGKVEPLNFPKANVLKFHLEQNISIAVRPSGTEPKIKYYFSAAATLEEISQYNKVKTELNQLIQRLIQAISA